MNLLLSLFEGLCNMALNTVITVCDFDPRDFEEADITA